MKKKILSVLMCATLALSVMACNDKEGATDSTSGTPTATTEKQTTTKKQETTTTTTTEAPAPTTAALEALPEAFAHLTFDGGDEGYTAAMQTSNLGSLTGATYAIEPAKVNFGYADGAVGKAIYLTGKFGLDLNLKPTNTDAYTISYWMNADRLANFGPTLQIGYNMGMAADVGNNVTWMNITQTDWGADAAKIFPLVWSRNEASDAADTTDCWPWMYSWDDSIHGKKEWVHVTVVCSGESQASPLGTTTAGAQYYVNGVLVYDSQENFVNNTYFEYTWDSTLAPNIMKPGDSEFESYFGINYWDTVFKGYLDDLYVFDKALTAGQVASLYALGDPTVQPVAPAVDEPVLDAPSSTDTPATPDTPAVTAVKNSTVGKTDCSTGWWAAHSDTWAVAKGETVSKTFVNWHSDAAANYHNFIVVLQNVADAHSANDNAAYKEYGVVRADNAGWNAVTNTWEGLSTLGWTLENNYNWDTFLADLQGATVTVSVTNKGTTAEVVCDVTSTNGNKYYQKYLNIAIDGDLYFCLSTEQGCLDIQGEATETVGNADCSTGWWADHSHTWLVPANKSVSKTFVNTHAADAANYHNFLAVLQNVADAHATADNAAYKEYAVVRADNAGWNAVTNTWTDLAALGWTLENTYNWDTFLADLQGATVVVTVTNKGTTADVVFDVTSTAGTTYQQKYLNIAIDGDLYFCLTAEKAYLEVK